MANVRDDDDIPPPQRAPSPPAHTTFQARGIHAPSFSAFRPRDMRIPSTQGMTHVAWSCDGKKLAAVGIDKNVRIWQPEKSMEMRASSLYSSGHSEDVDYISFNPTHPELFCTSSQKERRIVFWDARQTRNIQSVSLKTAPMHTVYAPDGRTIAWTSTQHQLNFLTLGRETGETKDQWRASERAGAQAVAASAGIFNHAGNGMVLVHQPDHNVRIVEYPALDVRESMAAHVSGGIVVALDPRGRYLATGGYDTVINLFDTTYWICSRTITACDHAINSLSFSHDGEFIAAATAGLTVDIFATETGEALHRVPALAAAPTVAWHPSKYLVAYCGQTPPRESGPAPVAVVSLFGPGQ